jgi:competence protein ComEC
LKRGQKIALKEGNVEITELELLTPFFDYGSSKIFDLNDQSVALKMNYPRKILFMGDNSQKTEKLLFTKESHNLQAEILKIGHHGSRFSTSNEFLNTIKPQTALISVGENNFYGHPAKETIRKLKDKNINFFRTDVDSRVEIIL